MILIRDDDKLRIVISQCLRDIVFQWHFMKFFDLKKNLLWKVSFRKWYDVLITRFKKRFVFVLNRMHQFRYTFVDVKKRKNFRVYAQNIFRYAKIVKMNFIFNQIILTWNNFDWQFRRDISKSKFDIVIWKIFFHLNSKTHIWYEMIKFTSKIVVRFNKQNFRQNDRAKNNDEYYQFVYQRRFDNNFFKSNQVYQNNQQNARRSIFVLSFTKQSLFLIDENTFDSRKIQKFSTNVERFDNVNRDDDKSRFKNKIYVINEKNENEYEIEEFSQLNDDAYFNDDLKYYDSNNLINDEKSEAHFVFSTSIEYVCRRCKRRFSFNNRMHVHFRIDCFRLQKFFDNENFFSNVFDNENLQFFANVFDNENWKFFANAYFTQTSFIDVIKAINIDKFTMIRFDTNVFKNVDIDYDFRDWSYVKVKVTLIKDDQKKNVIMNIDADITLNDENFVKRQKFDVIIRKMIFFIIVRGLSITQHESFRYIILFIYFFDITNDDVFVKTFIEKEIHLIKNLKTNMFIENDIIVSKEIFVNIINRIANIRSCDVIMSLNVRFKAIHAQQRFIHVKKIIVLSSRA